MIGIYANSKKENALRLAEELAASLSRAGIAFCGLKRDFTEVPDVIVVIGGDGTVLEVAKRAARADVPVMSVNAGGVGFLACFEADEIGECAKALETGEYKTERRPLLDCRIGDKTFDALNEVIVQRTVNENGNLCAVPVSLKINGEFVEKFRGDGLIVATPTGSTAYSLSAGGAILPPALGALIATPVSAHTLGSKPIVFSDDSVAEISTEAPYKAGVFCDGKFVCEITGDQNVMISRSDLSVRFVKGTRSFYETLFNKLNPR